MSRCPQEKAAIENSLLSTLLIAASTAAFLTDSDIFEQMPAEA
jgi:hypothetical protein